MAAAFQLEDIVKRITELENTMLLVTQRINLQEDLAAFRMSSAPASSTVAVVGGTSLQIPDGCGVNHNTAKKPDRLTVHYHLYYACSAGCFPCVKALLDANPYDFDINQGSQNEGFAAMDYAVWGKKSKQGAAGNHDAVIQLLRSRGGMRMRMED